MTPINQFGDSFIDGVHIIPESKSLETQLRDETDALRAELAKANERIAELEAAIQEMLDDWKNGAPQLSAIDHAFHVLEQKP
jgi:hypothetical protein